MTATIETYRTTPTAAEEADMLAHYTVTEPLMATLANLRRLPDAALQGLADAACCELYRRDCVDDFVASRRQPTLFEAVAA